MGASNGKNPKHSMAASTRKSGSPRQRDSGRGSSSMSSSSSSMKESEVQLGSHLVDLNEILGQGAFGIVYGGRHATSGARVAVKKLTIAEEAAGTAALEEIKKYVRLPVHANLVELLDYHFKDNAFWLVLEFCTDGTLEEYVCRNNPNEDTRFGFMLECARGIAHMHGADNAMVHRDIKPGNIMLSRVGGQLQVKITDFGLAKDAMLASKSLTQSKVGTPGFMAPEVVDLKPYNASVDVFSLGLVFLALTSFKKGDKMLVPKTVDGHAMVPVAMQMIMAAKGNQKELTITVPEAGDSAKMKTVKSVINQMVVYDSHKRISAAEAVRRLQSVVGGRAAPVTSGASEAGLAVALRRSRGAEAGGVDLRASVTPGKMLLEEILMERVREKAEEEVSVDGAVMLAQLLEHMPVMQMLAYALQSDSSDEDGSDDDDDSDDDSGGLSSSQFSVGERVRIESDVETAKALQEGHGGWVNSMRSCLGKVGVVKQKVMHVVKVEFGNGESWHLNPALLHKLDGSTPARVRVRVNVVLASNSRFKGDDVVVISEDENKVKRLQKGHGGWAEGMAKALGLKAIVHKVDSDGDVYVECINQDKWTFHPDALEHADTDSTSIRTGSLVLVFDDYETVRGFQDDRHGAWNEAMRNVLGKAGTVKELVTCDCVKVEFGERTWAMNTKALKHVATEGEMIAAVLRKLMT